MIFDLFTTTTITLLVSALINLGLHAFTVVELIKIKDTLQYQTLGFNSAQVSLDNAAYKLSQLVGNATKEVDALAESKRLQQQAEAAIAENAQLKQDVKETIAEAEKALDSFDSVQALNQILAEMAPIISEPQTSYDDLFFPDADTSEAVQERVDAMNDFIEHMAQLDKVENVGETTQADDRSHYAISFKAGADTFTVGETTPNGGYILHEYPMTSDANTETN